MKKIVIIIAASFSCVLVIAQNTRFSRLYSVISGIPCYAQRIAVYPDGYVLYGETDDSTDNYTRVSVTKIDTFGNLLWNKSYGKMGYDYYYGNIDGCGSGVLESSGNYLEAGWVTNDIDTWSHLTLFYFNSNGDTVWTKSYADSTEEIGITAKVTREKKYIVGGIWLGSIYTITLKKTDGSGNLIWQKTYHAAPSHYRESLSIDTCKDDGYIICAFDNDTNNFCDGSIFIMKLDSAGTPQWTNYIYGSPCFVGPSYVLSLNDGSYVVCGSYTDAVMNGPQYFCKPYLAKISSTGAVKWANQYGSGNWRGTSEFFSLKELPNGDIISCGLDSSNFWGCVIRVDSNGNQKWLRNYEIQSPSEWDNLYDIQSTSDGGFVAIGQTYGSTENIWVVKTDSLGCDTVGCDFASGVIELNNESDKVKVYPNPSNGIFTIELSNNTKSCDIEVYNMLGENVLTETLHPVDGGNRINLSNNSNGIYLYRVSLEDASLIGEGKIVIQK